MLFRSRSAVVLSQLKAIGVHLSIDDFGTGYSSLSRLQSFPVDTLKIDRSFISGMGSDPETHEIVRIIVMLAHNLGLSVVAEGVENQQQMEMLKHLGCELGQGYLFSRPGEAVTIEQLLISQNAAQSALGQGSSATRSFPWQKAPSAEHFVKASPTTDFGNIGDDPVRVELQSRQRTTEKEM